MQKILFTPLVLFYLNVCSQTISLPPSGDNQKCSVTQWIGLAKVTIKYNSPNVTGPNGEDRRGKIWGGVVPMGLTENNFGTAKLMPWRAGANENTTIDLSHNAKIEGVSIPAGSYGVHMIPGEDKWTIIFSNNANAWGSYFYNPQEDMLRVEVTPQKTAFTEWLTYDFIERRPTYTTACLKWEYLSIPFKIEVDAISIYLKQIRAELQGAAGFNWQNWIEAVDFCLKNNINLDEALLWSEYAIEAPFVGIQNFETLTTRAKVLMFLGRDLEAAEQLEIAFSQPTASMAKIHALGLKLVHAGKNDEAMLVFEYNKRKYPDDNFSTLIGLAIGNKAVGKTKKAIKNYRLAAENAPNGQGDYYLALAEELEKN